MAPRTPNQKIIHFSILILWFLFWLFRYLFLTSNLPVFWSENVLDLLFISKIYQLLLSYIFYLTKSHDIWYNTAHDTTTLKLISLISFTIWHECLEKSNSASILLLTSSFLYQATEWCWRKSSNQDTGATTHGGALIFATYPRMMIILSCDAILLPLTPPVHIVNIAQGSLSSVYSFILSRPSNLPPQSKSRRPQKNMNTTNETKLFSVTCYPSLQYKYLL